MKPQKLVERQDASGHTIEFYYDTDSVFCGDGECNVVSVRLFWNRLGFYTRYELAPGVVLEKAEGKPFTAADHKKLDETLRNLDSPLRNLRPIDIKNHEKADQDVDGVSSATPLLYQGVAVEGAAWTCFTLWHWANGEMSSIVRNITAKAATIPELRNYLQNDDARFRVFAVEQLIARQTCDKSIAAVATRQASRKDRNELKLVLQYLEQTEPGIFYPGIEKLFEDTNSTQRVMVLNALRNTHHAVPDGFMDRFCKQLATAKSYQEADLILRFVESHKLYSTTVARQAMRLLESKHFFIARRAYWFLSERSVSAEQQKQIDTFEQKYRDRL